MKILLLYFLKKKKKKIGTNKYNPSNGPFTLAVQKLTKSKFPFNISQITIVQKKEKKKKKKTQNKICAPAPLHRQSTDCGESMVFQALVTIITGTDLSLSISRSVTLLLCLAFTATDYH